jgi:RNA polymerase sigma-70 factor, ECF subfamily
MESAAMKYTDKSLIDAHRRGDPDAFGEIVRRYGDGILGYLFKMTGDKERAEDLFQETFQKVHEKSDTLRGDCFKSWLYKIATNAAYDGFRKDKQDNLHSKRLSIINDNQEELLSPDVPDNSSNPSVVTVKAEQAEQVRQAVNSLPDRQRATLVLAYYQQLSYSEVALALDCSIGTVKTQMYRALRTLAEKLPEVEL